MATSSVCAITSISIRHGWCLGKEAFRKELLAQMSERLGAEHYGEQRMEAAAMAARLRTETTITVGWIAERSRMGTRGHLDHLLYRMRHG